MTPTMTMLAFVMALACAPGNPGSGEHAASGSKKSGCMPALALAEYHRRAVLAKD
jgi:hypothetical protein